MPDPGEADPPEGHEAPEDRRTGSPEAKEAPKHGTDPVLSGSPDPNPSLSPETDQRLAKPPPQSQVLAGVLASRRVRILNDLSDLQRKIEVSLVRRLAKAQAELEAGREARRHQDLAMGSQAPEVAATTDASGKGQNLCECSSGRWEGLQTEVDRLVGANGRLEREATALRADNAELKAAFTEATSRLLDASTAADEAAAGAAARAAAGNSLVAAVADVEDRLSWLAGRNAFLDTTLSKLARAHSVAEARVAAGAAVGQAATARLTELDGILVAAQSSASAAANRADHLQSTVDSLRSTQAGLEAALAQAQADLREQTAALAAAGADVATKTARIAQLEETVAKLAHAASQVGEPDNAKCRDGV